MKTIKESGNIDDKKQLPNSELNKENNPLDINKDDVNDVKHNKDQSSKNPNINLHGPKVNVIKQPSMNKSNIIDVNINNSKYNDMSAAELDKKNPNHNNDVSHFQHSIINIEEDNDNEYKNNNKDNNDLNKSINDLFQFTQKSFKNLNSKFDETI